MAQTADDPITPEWCLLRAELEFVAAQCQSVPVAKELLLDWLHERRIRYRCEKLAYEGFTAAANRFFWHRASHSRITVDWDNSGAIRVGPPFVVQRDDEGDTLPVFLLDRPIISLKMRLIWLHHGDVAGMLREARLLSPAGVSPPPAPASALAATEAGDTAAVSGTVQSSAPAEPTDAPSVPPLTRLQQRIVAILQHLYAESHRKAKCARAI
jgi:hypothetical protein